MDVVRLNIQNLRCGYGKHVVPIYEITTELIKPTLVALTGKNGTGKSTLLRTLAGILRPLNGKILINNNELHNLSNLQRSSQIAFLPSYNAKIPYLKVTDYVSLGKLKQDKNQNPNNDTIYELLHKVDMESKANHFLTQLSDGEMQRVAIARILYQNSNILLFDEPTAHLDPKQQHKVLNLLFQITTEQNKIIIFSSHMTDMVLTYAHKIWLLGEEYFIDKIPEQIIIDKDFEKNELTLASRNWLSMQTKSGLNVRVLGDGLVYQYTKFAFLRYGIETHCNKHCHFSVIIQQNPEGKYSWLVKKEQQVLKEFTNLELLINYLLKFYKL